MNINLELDKLIYKYNLDRCYPEYRNSRKACTFLKKFIEDLSFKQNSYLFVGMDEFALNLICNWRKKDNINCLLIKSVNELDDYIEKLNNFMHIYVVSYTRSIEILHWLWKNNIPAESLYDMFENENIYLCREFYQYYIPLVISPELELSIAGEEFSIDGSSLELYEYYYQKQRLLHSRKEYNTTRIYKKMFFLAIQMKNFIEAEKILKNLESDKNYTEFWLEIQQLLIRIKEFLINKNQNNIVIYWMDGMRYGESEKMEYIQSLRNHSLYFNNAFTESPNTFPVLKSMLCGIRQVDDCGYNVRYIDLDNSFVLREIVRKGFQFKILGNYFRNDLPQDYIFGNYIEKARATCSEVYWNMINDILQSDSNTIYIAHTLSEIHPPSLSVRRDRFENGYLEAQFEELDSQLNFYDKMIGDKPYRIFMSDHGSRLPYRHQRLHIHFQIYHKSWIGRDVNKLFCYLDFYKILYRLMDEIPINDEIFDRNFIPLQDVDLYNKGHILPYFNWSYAPYLTAYKGVVTSEYIYIKYKAGDEIFHKLSDVDNISQIELTKLKGDSIIDEFRNKVGSFPIELDTDNKFYYSKFIYKVCCNLKKTINAVADLINKKFNTYSDDSIALRMGGDHSLQLYSLLTEDNRKKIGCIIDSNDKCKCSKLGYTILTPINCERGDIPKNITAILLSSYSHLEELSLEAEQVYCEYEIINIYQYFGVNGYTFYRDFWSGLDSDWDVGFPFD